MAFEIQPLDPQNYRQQTRRSTWVIAASFVLLALVCSSVAVQLVGSADGDNFWVNLGGVGVALLLTFAVVRSVFWSHPLMAAAVYGWRLKRSLMSITNVMHHVTAGVKVNDPLSMKILRFYHLGVTQMHHLDGNSGEHINMLAEIAAHEQKMHEQGIPVDQPVFDPQWLKQLERRA